MLLLLADLTSLFTSSSSPTNFPTRRSLQLAPSRSVAHNVWHGGGRDRCGEPAQDQRDRRAQPREVPRPAEQLQHAGDARARLRCRRPQLRQPVGTRGRPVKVLPVQVGADGVGLRLRPLDLPVDLYLPHVHRSLFLPHRTQPALCAQRRAAARAYAACNPMRPGLNPACPGCDPACARWACGRPSRWCACTKRTSPERLSSACSASCSPPSRR